KKALERHRELVEASSYVQMSARLRHHYRDAHITRRLPEQMVLRLFAEMQWIDEQEAKRNAHHGQGR
ncbi:MAG TPA: hypothetical protein PL070_08840, partial [Flavobacteriales bacterium]|nr:hypothetical protein [Flavobacteriales bacterium]